MEGFCFIETNVNTVVDIFFCFLFTPFSEITVAVTTPSHRLGEGRLVLLCFGVSYETAS